MDAAIEFKEEEVRALLGSFLFRKDDISKKTADSEWETQNLPIAWDNGKTDYSVTLKEIRTRPVPLLSAVLTRADDGLYSACYQTLACGSDPGKSSF